MPTGLMFTGTAVECLKHFVANLGQFSDEFSAAVKNHLQVEGPTINHWLNGDRYPKGETLVKLTLLMTVFGYEVIDYPKGEWEQLIADLIGLNLYSAEDLAKEIDYPGASAVLKFARGSRQVRRTDKLQALASLKNEIYDAKQKLAQLKNLAIGFLAIMTEVPVPAAGSIIHTPVLPVMIESFAHQLASALVLAQYFNSDQCSDADRVLLRETCVSPMEELRLALIGLSSKSARDEQKQQGRK
jgi:hypothetical protein